MGRVDNDRELVNQKHLEPEDAKKLLGFQLDVRGFTIHPRQNISSAKKSSSNSKIEDKHINDIFS